MNESAGGSSPGNQPIVWIYISCSAAARLLLAGLLALAMYSPLCRGQAQGVTAAVVSTDYSIVQRGPHSRLWQRMILRTNDSGIVSSNIQSYTELATGICHLANGEYVDSVEQITSVPGGAQAVQGRCRVCKR